MRELFQCVFASMNPCYLLSLWRRLPTCCRVGSAGWGDHWRQVPEPGRGHDCLDRVWSSERTSSSSGGVGRLVLLAVLLWAAGLAPLSPQMWWAAIPFPHLVPSPHRYFSSLWFFFLNLIWPNCCQSRMVLIWAVSFWILWWLLVQTRNISI